MIWYKGRSCSCDGDEGWVREDTANVAGSGTDLDVTIVTPSSTPLILNEEELLSVLSSVSDSQDTVIEGSSASRGNNTGGVVLESSLVGFDGNRDWTELKSVLKSISVVSWDIRISWNGTGSTVCFGVIASSILGLVRIVSRGSKWSSLDVFEGIVHPSTVATIVTVGGGAINELLLGVVNKWVSSNGSSGWDTSGSGEGPAATTLSLVLNRGNFPSSNPINGTGGWCSHEAGISSWGGSSRLESWVNTSDGFQFGGRPGGELVVSNFTGVSGGVEWLNLLVSHSIVALSIFEFALCWIWFSICGNIGHEFVVSARHGSITVELRDLIGLDDLEDDTGSDGRSSDSTTTNLEESSFVLHIKY